MKLDLTDKVFIVTGGASGIGRSIVQHLAAEKAIPCVIDRNPFPVGSRDPASADSHDAVLSLQADLTDLEACQKAVGQIRQRFGAIHGLVNNAGTNDGVGLRNGNYAAFVESLAINVGHYYSMAKLLLPALQETKGVIVNICSKVAETGQGGTSGYAAANGVRMGLTTAWAQELCEIGIRVNGVVVAECLTPQYEWWVSKQPDPQETLHKISARIPFERRMTSSDEIADTVLFLLSKASAPVNGEFFHVDGGYVHLDRGV